MPFVLEDLGSRIRAERQRYGMSQAELARRSHLSKTAMNDIETGDTANPGIKYIVAIANALHVSLDALLCRDEDGAA